MRGPRADPPTDESTTKATAYCWSSASHLQRLALGDVMDQEVHKASLLCTKSALQPCKNTSGGKAEIQESLVVHTYMSATIPRVTEPPADEIPPRNRKPMIVL